MIMMATVSSANSFTSLNIFINAFQGASKVALEKAIFNIFLQAKATATITARINSIKYIYW